MVASSCVTTIMILNYHHRMADTHEMPEWVSISSRRTFINIFLNSYFLDFSSVSPVAALAAEDVKTRRKNNKEDNHDGQEDEGAGHQGDLLQVSALQCSGHGRWLQKIHAAENSSQHSSPSQPRDSFTNKPGDSEVNIIIIVCEAVTHRHISCVFSSNFFLLNLFIWLQIDQNHPLF